MSNLTSEEWAAWVQAIGSVIAIAATGFGVWYQSNRQHKSALALYKLEKRHTMLELAKTLSQLANNCHKMVQFITSEFNSREAVDSVFRGEKHLDWVELRSIEGALKDIPLINIPSSLLTHVMVLTATIRQFRENIEFAIKTYREMDAAAFAVLFQTETEVIESLRLTCSDIATEVRRIEWEGTLP